MLRGPAVLNKRAPFLKEIVLQSSTQIAVIILTLIGGSGGGGEAPPCLRGFTEGQSKALPSWREWRVNKYVIVLGNIETRLRGKSKIYNKREAYYWGFLSKYTGEALHADRFPHKEAQ